MRPPRGGLSSGCRVDGVWTDELRRSDSLLYGRVTYELMQSAWRRPESGEWPDWMDASEVAFSKVTDPMRKYVVSTEMDAVDWNASLVGGDLASAVRELKAQSGRGISVGGVRLPAALANLGLIDEFAFVVHPVVSGRGPRLLDGVRGQVALELVERWDFGSGVVMQRYRRPV